MAAEMTVTREKLAEYLADPNKFDCGIAISNPDVITMHQGTAIGYFCPPPQVRLFGDGWKKLFGNTEKTWQSKPHFTLGIAQFPFHGDRHLDLSSEKRQTVDNMLYVPDCAENDYLSLKVNMFRPPKQDPESFLSKPIKIAIEPSNRIRSGSTVAIFNKSETTKTRYLHLTPGCYRLIPSRANWSSFVIYLMDANSLGEEEKDFKTKEGYINYGSIVQLVDSVTDVALPLMRIMEVINGIVAMDQIGDQNTPVCQLENCAFQLFDKANSYVSIQHNKIESAYGTDLNDVIDEIQDTEIWTIMSTNEAKYRFYEAMGPVSDLVTPVPTITLMEMKKTAKSDGTPITLVEFTGSYFRNEHQIWCGLHELRQNVDSTDRITCVLPTYDEVWSHHGMAYCNVKDTVIFPITITRNDGVVFGTPYYFSYYEVADDGGEPAMVHPLTECMRPKRLRWF
uniref:Major capsid protein n=1 Tax=Panagrellus redivivus TaxID=6233 RepID=A0A7E4V6R1_PANRE